MKKIFAVVLSTFLTIAALKANCPEAQADIRVIFAESKDAPYRLNHPKKQGAVSLALSSALDQQLEAYGINQMILSQLDKEEYAEFMAMYLNSVEKITFLFQQIFDCSNKGVVSNRLAFCDGEAAEFMLKAMDLIYRHDENSRAAFKVSTLFKVAAELDASFNLGVDDERGLGMNEFFKALGIRHLRCVKADSKNPVQCQIFYRE